MPGPLPSATKRRRNASTITSSVLPSKGREGRAPTVPRSYKLGPAGRAFWRWAWKLPQATKWDGGTVYAVARRAQLEDDLAAVNFNDVLDLEDLLAGADPDAVKRVEWALSMLKRSASGSTSIMKEQTQLDDRLGLNPKALAALRWMIDEPADKPAEEPNVTQIAAYRERLG